MLPMHNPLRQAFADLQVWGGLHCFLCRAPDETRGKTFTGAMLNSISISRTYEYEQLLDFIKLLIHTNDKLNFGGRE